MLFEQWGLWESIIVVSLFSVVVILADEFLHARRRRAREREGGRPAH
jgi:hypothetical protein